MKCLEYLHVMQVYLTLWSTGLLKKLIMVAQLVKKLPAFCGARRFTAVLTTPHHWALSETT
jgi:hypothetical protein